MGVFTYEAEVVSPIPPAKMFQALFLNGDKLISKVLPQAFKSVEILEGDGGPGTVKKITFADESQFNYVKHKVEAVDKDNWTFCYSVIEGDALMNKLEKITYETKLIPSPDGGSICKSTNKYYPIGDFEIKEQEVKAGEEKTLGIFKALEAYILANPDAC